MGSTWWVLIAGTGMPQACLLPIFQQLYTVKEKHILGLRALEEGRIQTLSSFPQNVTETLNLVSSVGLSAKIFSHF